MTVLVQIKNINDSDITNVDHHFNFTLLKKPLTWKRINW